MHKPGKPEHQKPASSCDDLVRHPLVVVLLLRSAVNCVVLVMGKADWDGLFGDPLMATIRIEGLGRATL